MQARSLQAKCHGPIVFRVRRESRANPQKPHPNVAFPPLNVGHAFPNMQRILQCPIRSSHPPCHLDVIPITLKWHSTDDRVDVADERRIIWKTRRKGLVSSFCALFALRPSKSGDGGTCHLDVIPITLKWRVVDGGWDQREGGWTCLCGHTCPPWRANGDVGSGHEWADRATVRIGVSWSCRPECWATRNGPRPRVGHGHRLIPWGMHGTRVRG